MERCQAPLCLERCLTPFSRPHTLIEDERSALARLPGLGAKAGAKESVRATGTVSCNAACAAQTPT